MPEQLNDRLGVVVAVEVECKVSLVDCDSVDSDSVGGNVTDPVALVVDVGVMLIVFENDRLREPTVSVFEELALTDDITDRVSLLDPSEVNDTLTEGVTVWLGIHDHESEEEEKEAEFVLLRMSSP